MDRYWYSAAARLGLWDTLPEAQQGLVNNLYRRLRFYAHAVLEGYEAFAFDKTESESLSSLLAVIDKLTIRGCPTLVDLDLETALLEGPCRQFVDAVPIEDGPVVGWKFRRFLLPVQFSDLIRATVELLELPFSSNGKDGTDDLAYPVITPELEALSSEEEHLFIEQFANVFGSHLLRKLRRQVPLQDLVPYELEEPFVRQRVDFALQIGRLRYVFEIDGRQHLEPGQRRLDDQRDQLLKNAGWQVIRIPVEVVRQGRGSQLQTLHDRLREAQLEGLEQIGRTSVLDLVASSDLYRAALYGWIYPLAVHRCLRGLAFLYRFGYLDAGRPQRVLVIEEDIPVVASAFRILHTYWDHLRALAPEVPPPPTLEVDVIGCDEIEILAPVEGTRRVTAPSGSYDLVLDHSFWLYDGSEGPLEKELQPLPPGRYVRLRRAFGLREERSLTWSAALHYDLGDLERALIAEAEGRPAEMPERKVAALRFFLQQIFRKRDFWEGQLRVIARLLQGRPTVVLLPTGGGKSLTYQYSGMLLPGMTIVVDPLISLMIDQVDTLRGFAIDMVASISSIIDTEARERIIAQMGAGKLAYVFISPERLQSDDFRQKLQDVAARLPISLAVVDEAHCVSEWGHDFRPSYLHMTHNLQKFCASAASRPTLVALTGTASFAVLTDIQAELGITDESAIVLPRSFDRKEIRFHVERVPREAKMHALKRFRSQLPYLLRVNPQRFFELSGAETNCGIVFCPHVNGELGVWEVALELGHGKCYAGKQPRSFNEQRHGKWPDFKLKVQKDFKHNRIQEIVATKSFGMGIDKPNIRYTIHICIPHSVEAFYQEAGRAGRNGKPGYAISAILYSDENWVEAMGIFNEADHRKAQKKIENIPWNSRGDLLIQLWLLYNTYRGRDDEYQRALDFWKRYVRPELKELPVGATRLLEIPFTQSRRVDDEEEETNRGALEKSIFRMVILRIVEDYTIDWNQSIFQLRVRNAAPIEIKQSLRNYLGRYKLPATADQMVQPIPEDDQEKALEAALEVLIDFVYGEIAAKRKQALRTMAELCRNFRSDRDFREAILAYLQESEFSAELRTWIGRGFDEIGLEKIRDLLGKLSSLDEIKRLVGTTRRMLDEDPGNVPLRYLSAVARALSRVESEESVLEEVVSLTLQILRLKDRLRDPDEILAALLGDLATARPELLARAADRVLRLFGTPALARRLLQGPAGSDAVVRNHAAVLLMAESLRTIRESAFYQTLVNAV